MSTTAAPIDPAYAAESNTSMLLGVITFFHILAWMFISARLYARIVLVRQPGADDAVIVLSGVCALGGWIVFVIQSYHGLGKHQKTISPADYQIFQQAGFWQSIISTAGAIMFLKISIALNLLRLSNNKWYSGALWFIMGLTVIYCVGGMFPFFLYCRPMAAYWDLGLRAATGAQCMTLSMFVMFSLINTSFSIATDVLLASVPVPIIWGLQMKRRVRFYVIGILSLGYLAVAMGIVKAIYQIAFGTDTDKTYYQRLQFFGWLQLQLGIIAACAPALKPLVGKILRLSSHDAAYYQYGSNGYGNGRTGRSRAAGGATGKDPTLVTIGGAGAAPRTLRDKDGFELSERDIDGDSDHTLSNSKGHNHTSATFYQHHPEGEDRASGTGSEEKIWSPVAVGRQESATARPNDFRGIMRTTEVIVK